MAEIYLARATGIEGFERYVVVKRILGEHAKDKRFVSMFIDEARLAAQLHHQNIAQVYDCGQDDGTYYFAMEYVHGENLRELLKKMAMARRQLALEHALTIIAGGCAGLHYAHDKKGADRQPLGIVHRDVSPSNLIVAYDGGIKVVDFGIAKAASRMSETRSGTLKGKIAYMSPEQCLGKALDRRSDIFALGIVMYELTTVSRLFKGENDYITMNRIVTGDIPSPTKKRPDYPPALEAIVMKALALDPADRYQTAGEMLEAIEQFATRERISLSTTALGRFIRELFGERPEPWQDLAALDPREPSSDEVDIVEVTRSNVGGDTAITPAPVAGAAVSAVSNPSSVSYVPPPRRNWAWLGVALLAAAVAIGALIMAVSPSSTRDSGVSGSSAPSGATGAAPGSASGSA
ncbi:MAG: serine/threonine protein kinase, partial [Deltaproteobacteria bacterium]|nr:serine/threonine protein kinase [Deltaproteobacteria bacterium]